MISVTSASGSSEPRLHRGGSRAVVHAGLALVLTLGGAVLVVACNAQLGGPEGQSPGVTFPHHIAEGHNEAELDGGPSDAAVTRTSVDGAAGEAAPRTSSGRAGAPRTGYAPDPEPLRMAEQYEYVVVHEDDAVRIASVDKKTFEEPLVTPRRMGRYAIELWIGAELIERVRFDFPLSAAERPRESEKRPLFEQPRFAPGLEAGMRVLVPASPRATRAVLLDRTTGETSPLPWPPDAPIEPVDGGILRGVSRPLRP